MKSRDKLLLALIGLNILASVLHYGHNMWFFSQYPEPSWINPGKIDRFWFFMTAFALLGVYWQLKGARWRSTLALVLYSLMSLLVLGHYFYGSFFAIPFQIHLFIWIEALCALALLGYVARALFNDGDRQAATSLPL